MNPFADTSFLCSNYFSDIHSAKSDVFLRQHDAPVGVSTLVVFEFRQSLRLQEFQNGRDHTIGKNSTAVAGMLNELQTDLRNGGFEIVAPDWPAVHQLAESLSAKHTHSTGNRFADILHVATALHLGVSHFLTFDTNQRALAETEGLVVPLDTHTGSGFAS